MQIRIFYVNKGWKSPRGNSILLLNGYLHKKFNILIDNNGTHEPNLNTLTTKLLKR